jgi:hypothetical protein
MIFSPLFAMQVLAAMSRRGCGASRVKGAKICFDAIRRLRLEVLIG